MPLSNAVPFAVGDLEIALVAALLIGGWIVALRRARGARLRTVLQLVAHTARLAAAIVVAFNLLWGWNYRRVPVAARVDYVAARVTPASVSAFADRIASILNDDVGPAHERMRSESPAAMRAELAGDFLPVVERLGDTWTPAVTVPKATIAERIYEMAGVGGQYDPFAFETLLNTAFLPFEVPRALAHEWSHAAGFGDEGDANLIGTLTCLRSSDPLIRYSGAYWTYGELPESDRRRIHLAAGGRRRLQRRPRALHAVLQPAPIHDQLGLLRSLSARERRERRRGELQPLPAIAGGDGVRCERLTAARAGQRKRVGQLIVRHICEDELSSQPKPSSGWRKLRATMSRNGSRLTDMLGSNE